MIEHHKEHYEAEVAVLEAAAMEAAAVEAAYMSSSTSDSEFSLASEDDDISSFSSVDTVGVDTELATPTTMPELDFDIDMDIIEFDVYDSSDAESSMSPLYVQ